MSTGSYNNTSDFLPIKAGQDYTSADQYRAAKLDSSGRVIPAGAGEGNGLFVQSVNINKDDTDKVVEVAYPGVGTCLATAGAALATPGTELMSDANGKLVAATTGNNVIAISMEAAAADGDIFEVMPVSGWNAA